MKLIIMFTLTLSAFCSNRYICKINIGQNSDALEFITIEEDHRMCVDPNVSCFIPAIIGIQQTGEIAPSYQQISSEYNKLTGQYIYRLEDGRLLSIDKDINLNASAYGKLITEGDLDPLELQCEKF